MNTKMYLAPFRFFAMFLMIFVFLGHMGLVYALARGRWVRTRASNRLLSRYARWGLWVLGIRVNPVGLEHRELERGALYVGNHLSYVDVLVVSAFLPAGFVTSREIRETPFLGFLCEMAGCLFVERRSRAQLRAEVAEISEGLRFGLQVAIFPEATSTNGEQVLRFRRPLYLAAMEAGVSVIPFCLNYRTVGGENIDRANRDSVFWYGDMDFVPHLWALSWAGAVSVDLHFLSAVSVDGKQDPGELAEITQRLVEEVFIPVATPPVAAGSGRTGL